MVITKTPFRMSFFGGGTDYEEYYKEYGGSVISTTFNKYCIVSVSHVPRFFEYTNQVTYSKIEQVKKVEEIQHPLVRNAMKYLDMHELRVDYNADLPAKSGLGTSSAFAVGMLNAFYALNGKYVDKQKLAKDAIYLERVLCGESGGIQDQIATAYGGLNRIDFSDSGFVVAPIIIKAGRKRELNENLMLFFTGFTRFSSEIASVQQKNIKNRLSVLKEMHSLVNDSQEILSSSCDLNEFGKLLAYTWKLKKSISSKISTDSTDYLYQKAIDAGALGGKILGAGGGGFLLLYVEKDKQQKVKKALGDCIFVPFEFEQEGTKVFYYQMENYNPDKIID